MKYDFKKEMPLLFKTKKPTIVNLPKLKYITISGSGDPNHEAFEKSVQALYTVMYTLKFAYKKNPSDLKWVDFVVSPLIGWWTINDQAIERKTFTKDDFVFELRLLIPEFVKDELVLECITSAYLKKRDENIKRIMIKEYDELLVGQILHIGSYDTEQLSFNKLSCFFDDNNIIRTSKDHVEIYLSDPRKVEPDKLKTILQVTIASK